MNDAERATTRSIDNRPAELADGSRLRHTEDLIDRIKESADQLARDGSTRGDLKILSRALRELRYAFTVFTPYRRAY